MKLFSLMLLFSSSVMGDCMPRQLPPAMQGPVDAVLDLKTLDRWKEFREARVQERMVEAFDPQFVHATYRVEQHDIDAGCFSLEQLVDLGRALFLREFTAAEGLGGKHKASLWYQRFQDKDDPIPHATSCSNCHWKGGFAGAGDRVDNAFLAGDGNVKASHQERNPLSLSGIGWVEIAAREMTQSLQTQKKILVKAVQKRSRASTQLTAKGVNFGTLRARRHAGKVTLDFSQVEGVTEDLIVKPFGWRGDFATIAEVVAWSFETHLGLYSVDTDRGEGLARSTISEPSSAQLTQGQITAVSTFLATLSSPVIEIPTVAGLRPDLLVPVAEAKSAPEFTQRWAAGQRVFNEVGCADCHRPKIKLEGDQFSLGKLNFSLHSVAASPQPERLTSQDNSLSTSVYLFSDLKQYNMGYGKFITRPLWGLRNSAPYSVDGSANVVDQAIAKHNHPQGAARDSADKFKRIHEKYKADLRVFLYSLMRAPEIRIR